MADTFDIDTGIDPAALLAALNPTIRLLSVLALALIALCLGYAMAARHGYGWSVWRAPTPAHRHHARLAACVRRTWPHLARRTSKLAGATLRAGHDADGVSVVIQLAKSTSRTPLIAMLSAHWNLAVTNVSTIDDTTDKRLRLRLTDPACPAITPAAATPRPAIMPAAAPRPTTTPDLGSGLHRLYAGRDHHTRRQVTLDLTALAPLAIYSAKGTTPAPFVLSLLDQLTALSPDDMSITILDGQRVDPQSSHYQDLYAHLAELVGTAAPDAVIEILTGLAADRAARTAQPRNTEPLRIVYIENASAFLRTAPGSTTGMTRAQITTATRALTDLATHGPGVGILPIFTSTTALPAALRKVTTPLLYACDALDGLATTLLGSNARPSVDPTGYPAGSPDATLITRSATNRREHTRIRTPHPPIAATFL